MDLFSATAADLVGLGWKKWSSDSPLYLCPESQFADLPDGIALHGIFGDVVVKGRDHIDDDTRFGCLAYGIIPGKTGTEVSAEQVATRATADTAEFLDLMVEVTRTSGLHCLGSDGITVLRGDDAEDVVRSMVVKA